MKHFKPGEFERHRVHSALRPFCPLAAVHAITELNLDDLAQAGKELILLDVDNTLVEWKQEEFAPSVIGWLEEAKAKGFSLCILSNTRHPARLNRISERLGIPYIRDRFKPSTRMYNIALAQTGKQPSQAIMIGDQIFTDILGANRAGIEAVWVHRISPREFVGTRFLSRMMERLLVPLLNRALPIMSKMPDPVGAPEETPLLTQLFRFGVVGASSFVIDTGVLLLLSSIIGFGGLKLGTTVGTWLIRDQIAFFGHYEDPVRAASVFFKPLSTIVAMLNSFFWNRRWTFGITEPHAKAEQFKKFVALNVGGLIIATSMIAIFQKIIPGHATRSLVIAQVLATIVQAVWNFGGQRLWAFRKS